MNVIWEIAELLRDDYKHSEYGRVILPLVVIAPPRSSGRGHQAGAARQGRRQVDDVIAEENPNFRAQALSNDEEDFAAGKEDFVIDEMLKVQEVNDIVIEQSLNDDELLSRTSEFLIRALYKSHNADAQTS